MNKEIITTAYALSLSEGVVERVIVQTQFINEKQVKISSAICNMDWNPMSKVSSGIYQGSFGADKTYHINLRRKLADRYPHRVTLNPKLSNVL